MTVPSDQAAGRGPGTAGGNARWLAAASLLLVFLAGAGAGWGLGSRYGRGFGRGEWGPRRGGGGRGGMLLDGGPIGRYDLSDGQRHRIDSVLEARRGQIDGFWRGPGLALRGILDSTRADVRAALTPAQQARFDSAHAEHERRMRDKYGPDGLGGPPGPGGMFGGPGRGHPGPPPP